jgi:serine/threonine protein kinase
MFRGPLLPNPGPRVSDPRHQLQADLADRYVLERELGRGGMATVYLSHDLRHDRSVALKVLHPDLAATLGPERFQREIRLAARLQHPHILNVLDSGEAAGSRRAAGAGSWCTQVSESPFHGTGLVSYGGFRSPLSRSGADGHDWVPVGANH